MRKTMKKLTHGASRLLVLALGLGLASTAWADFQKTNPVTGEAENYTWKFVGTDTWDGTGYWKNSSDANPSGVPAKSGGNTWDPILFDGNTINIVASMSVEGWNLRLGLYNGANVRLNSFVKWQGGTTMWVTVDDTSKFTVGAFGKGNIADNQVLKCSTTRENGIEWLVNLESTGNANNTFEYYLAGAGSVSYQSVSAANHKIKMADVTVSGKKAKSLKHKTIVSFTSSSKTFTADATIKIKNSSGTVLGSKSLSKMATASTLTTASPVGTCELVQTSTGIDLYWVDGIYNGNDMRVLGSDVTICSAATSGDKSGYNNITTGTIVFNTPEGCSTGDHLLFSKLEMIGHGQSGGNSYATTITLTDPESGVTYTSGAVVSTANATIGNFSSTVTKLTYNFPNVEVKAGSTYNITFNLPSGYTGVRYGVESSASGYVIATPASGGWRPYGVITATKVLGSSPVVGSTIMFSNTASRGALKETANGECNFAVNIPASSGLPMGSVVKVKRINFAGWNDKFQATDPTNYKADPYGIYLNAQRSYNLLGTSKYDNNTNPGQFSLSNSTIQANATTSPNRLSFSFVDGYIPQLTVGTTYTQAADNGEKALNGKGVTFLHYNGNQNASGSTDYCSVRYIASSTPGIISTSTSTGYYPVYEMYAEVVSIPDGHTATISSSPASWADIAWDVAMPEDTSEEDAKINVTGDATIALSDVVLNKLTLNVSEGVTLTLTGTLTTADSIAITGDGEVDMTELTITGTVVGDGTVVYASTKPISGLGWTAGTWTGTVKITDLTNGGYVPFDEYGNENSYIKAPGFTGYTKMSTSDRCLATLVIDSDTTFTLNNGNSGTGFKFSKLSGSGNLVLTGKTQATTQYVFEDVSGFTGNVTVDPDNDGSNWNDKSIVLGAPTTWTINATSCNNYKGKLVIAGNVTVATGKTFSGATVVNGTGTLTLGGTGSTISGTVTGSGTLVCNQVDLSGSGFDNASGWTGKVQIAGDTQSPTTYFDEAAYGNASSTLEVVSGHVAITAATSLPGTVNVASGATLYMMSSSITDLSISGTNRGSINMQMASGTTLTLSDGIARGKVVYPSSLKTLNMVLDENLADGSQVLFSVGNVTTLTSATVTMNKPDGTVNDTVVSTLSGDGHSITVSYTPTVDGSAAWCAYEFATSDSTALKNTGNTSDALSPDDGFTAATSVDGSGKLYTYSHPYRSIDYPSDGNWSAMVRCTVPKLAEALVVAFGTRDDGIIGLAAGATPDNEMRVVQTTGNSHYLTNGVMSVLNGTTAQHVYVFTVASNQTVKVYCDNELINTVVFPSRFSIGGGLQIGSIYAGIGSTGLKRCWYTDTDYAKLSDADQKAARIDSLRLYKATLGANAIAQLSEEFPAVKLFEATISGGTENEWATLGWTGGDITTINAYSKAIVTVEDDATLNLPASIIAEDLEIDIASGKTLTLAKASGGTTFTLRNPLVVNEGTIAISELFGFGNVVDGTGTLRLGNGIVVNRALSGNVKVGIASGETVAVMSGGSIANTLTGAGTLTYQYYGSIPGALTIGNWSGIVVLPGATVAGIDFNNFGKSGSKVVVAGAMTGWIAADVTFAPEIELDANLTVNDASGYPYTFTKISGTGNLSFSTQTFQPTSVTITEVAEDYTGTISSTLTTPVTITTLARSAGTSTEPGEKLLTTSGNVTASALTVGGVAQSVTLCTESDGIYVAAASVQKGENPATYHTTIADAMTEAGSGAATITLLGNTDSNISLAVGQSLVTGGFSVGTVSTGATYYHVVDNAGTYTVVLDTYTITIPSVANTTVIVSYTSGGASQTATAAGAITVDAGTSLTATWTAASGYKITAGASQTINPVASAQTLASPTVEAKGATVSDVTFNYGNDFATATVTATVSGDATAYTLTVGVTDYAGSVSGSTVTFSNVATGHATAYDNVSYAITASDGTSPVDVSGGSGSVKVADMRTWIHERAASSTGESKSATGSGGSWTTAVTYNDNIAAVENNTFSANNCSTGDCVTVTVNDAVYTSLSDTSNMSVFDEDSQGAVALGETNVNEVTTMCFMILAKEAGNFVWKPAIWDGNTPQLDTPYDIAVTFDYAAKKYSVCIDGTNLTVGVATNFNLCAEKSELKSITFNGEGTLRSIEGIESTGYMVKAANGTYYPTIAAAITAYNADSTIGELYVLHDGTVPVGWMIIEVGGVKYLRKAPKGSLFIAF